MFDLDEPPPPLAETDADMATIKIATATPLAIDFCKWDIIRLLRMLQDEVGITKN